MIRKAGRVAAIASFLFASASIASAAEIRVFSTIGVKAALEELATKFEKSTGDKLAVTFGTAAILVKKVQAGESADVLVLTKQGLEALAKDGKVAPGSDASFASSGMALVVKQGAPKPDISTPEAYKQALLKAKSIAYSSPASGGASGVFFAKSLDMMGIADAVKDKTHFPPPSGNSANLVVTGEAELAVQQEPEVMEVSGVDIVGPPPGDLNNITTYTAGVPADSKEPNGAKVLIKFLQTPEAAAVYKARGLKPAVAPKAS
jgi:molybdate transport system substrate-binding protein